MRQNHLAFHIHHDSLIEYIHHEYGGLEGRRDFVRHNKSCHTKRCRLMHEVPDELLPAAVLAAALVVDDAVAGGNWLWIRQKEADLDRAIAAHADELNAIHRELCPNCPWDGKTIFTQEDYVA